MDMELALSDSKPGGLGAGAGVEFLSCSAEQSGSMLHWTVGIPGQL